MGKIKMTEYVEKKKRTEFEFVEIVPLPPVDADGVMIHKTALILKEPMEEVYGIGEFTGPNGETVPIIEYDVQKVIIHDHLIKEYEDDFEVEEDENGDIIVGKYSGTLFFDVTSDGDVLLTNQSIKQWAKNTNRERSRKKNTDRFNLYQQRMNNRRK